MLRKKIFNRALFHTTMERKEFLEIFHKVQQTKQYCTILCSCAVTYSGRAEAYLPRGDRVIMIKQDGVLLIHQPTNGNPINYLKAGGELSVEKYDGHLTLHGKLGKEFLDVELFQIYDVLHRRLEDGQRQELVGSEADMSDHLRENPTLLGKNFIPVSREEQTKVGFIDLFGHDGKGELIVVECKRYTAGLAAVSQLHRYVEKIKQVKGTKNVTGIMAAPKMTPNAEAMLKEYNYSWREVRPPKRLERYDKKQTSLEKF